MPIVAKLGMGDRPMKLRHAFAAIACLMLTPAAALAQDEEEVVITGTRLRDAVRDFVGAVTVETGGDDQVARWDGRVCPGVIGMAPTQAQAVVDRVAMHALDLGLQVGEPGCAANLLVIFTRDSDTVARELVAQHRRALGYYDGDGNTRGRAALTDFAETSRPVRWWHVANTADESGFIIQDSDITGAPPPTVQGPPGGSRINRATQQVFSRVIVIVDADRVTGARVGTIADYVSMAALAQLDPDADTTQWPTILNAFRAGVPEDEIVLTEWDVSYLRGLYGADGNRSGGSQRRAIQRAVVEGGE